MKFRMKWFLTNQYYYSWNFIDKMVSYCSLELVGSCQISVFMICKMLVCCGSLMK